MPSTSGPGRAREDSPEESRDAAEVGIEESRAAWAEAARPILIEVAQHYQAVIIYEELAAGSSASRGSRARASDTGSATCSTACPAIRSAVASLLSALCVNAEGRVGEGYADAVAARTGELTGDGDDHAAEQRVACYRYFEAPDLPAEGGSAALRQEPHVVRGSRRSGSPRRPRRVPTCNTQLPATKVCDNYCS